MYQNVIQEARDLVKKLRSPPDYRGSLARYLCAIFAELAYYHIPQWEIDGNKRAKLIPCDWYQAKVKHGEPTDIRRLDFPNSFVVEDRGVVVVGVVLNKLLFVGYRGTQFLFDWKVNLRSKLVPVSARYFMRPPFILSSINGRLHSGFGEEAMRISTQVLAAIRDSDLGDVDHVFLAGHSLGGAVAAISENFVNVAPTTVCIFGSPRYADLSTYFTLPNGPPAHVRRPDDVVPTVPPKSFGYVDHPYEITTCGKPYIAPALSPLKGFLQWGQFLLGRFEPHSIESYRYELGKAVGANASVFKYLIDVEKMTQANIDSI